MIVLYTLSTKEHSYNVEFQRVVLLLNAKWMRNPRSSALKWICPGFFTVYLFLYCRWRSISRREGWDPINWFNSAIFLCLSQARTWISNVVCCGLFLMLNDLRWDAIAFCLSWWNCWWLFILAIHNTNHYTPESYCIKWQ